MATTTVTALGQGVYIHNGFGVSGDYQSFEGVDSYGGTLGYVYRGLVEGGLSVSRSTEDENDLEVNATSFAPFVALYPVRQSARMPVSVRLGSSLAFHSFSGNALELPDLEVDMSGRTLNLGGQVFRSFTVNPKFSLIPSVGADYVRSTLEFKTTTIEGLPFEETVTDDGAVFRLALSGAFRVKHRNIVSITPTFLVSDQGDTAFGFNVGLARGR